jgi:hypothetical protein
MSEDRFQWLFDSEDAKALTDVKALNDMISLRTLDRPRFETLLEHVKGLKPMGGMRRFIGMIDSYERDIKKEERRKARSAGGDALEADEDGFIRNKDGVITSRAHNVRNALTRMGIALRYDEFSCKAFYIDEGRDMRPVDDAFLEDYWVRMDDEFSFSPTFSSVWKYTVFETARQDSFHPVRDLLNSIEWDGEERLDSWLVDYLGAEDTPFNRKVGELVLKAGVARILQPGIKFDTALLLQGAQGKGKSSVVRAMAMNVDWHTESVPLQESDQKIIETTQGKWIVEIAEMRGRDRVSADTAKAQITRTHDRSRMAFGHISSDWARQFIFIITANPKQLFTDQTGNRRFWPVVINDLVDIHRLRAIMPQLWAEAYIAMGAGFGHIHEDDLKLPKELWDAANKLTNSMMITNPYLEKLESVMGDTKGIISSTEVWDILGVPVNQRTRYELFGAAMETMGFTKVRRKYGGMNNVTCYVRWPDNGTQPVELVADRSSLDGRVRGVTPRVDLSAITHDDDEDAADD